MKITINPNVQQATLAISAVNIQPGALPNGTIESLMELKYAFPNFIQPGIGDDFVKGDLVVFYEDATATYGCQLKHSDTSDLDYAPKMLMLFVGYVNGTLTVMHKGYMDYEDDEESPLANWTAGSTIYASQTGIDTSPNDVSANWVKSIGFCFPNVENKRRIWFESDSTYLIIG
jgi:hypothetical protein